MDMNGISIVKIGSQISEENLQYKFTRLGLTTQGRESAYWVQKTGSQTSEENLLVGFEENWVSNP
jgi:hypothetical protein